MDFRCTAWGRVIDVQCKESLNAKFQSYSSWSCFYYSEFLISKLIWCYSAGDYKICSNRNCFSSLCIWISNSEGKSDFQAYSNIYLTVHCLLPSLTYILTKEMSKPIWNFLDWSPYAEAWYFVFQMRFGTKDHLRTCGHRVQLRKAFTFELFELLVWKLYHFSLFCLNASI